MRGWTFDHFVGGFTTRVPTSKSTVSPEFSFLYGDVRIGFGTIDLNLFELEKAGCIRIDSSNRYRIRIWHDGLRFFISPTKDSGPKHYIGIEYDVGILADD